jgi:hypothetical protein
MERELEPHMEFTDPVYIILALCVTNTSYWLPLNEGFKCNCIKTYQYVIFVLGVGDSYVSL